MNTDKMIKVCEAIAADANQDAENFDGQPFTGKTVGAYFGYHGASIASLADMVKSILEEMKTQQTENKNHPS